jgi:hypothetical protein
MDVQIEGKNVHLLGDPMLNNCGPSGSPPNAATMQGLKQVPKFVPDCCADPKIVREPPAGSESRSTEELVKSLEDEAARLKQIGLDKLSSAKIPKDIQKAQDSLKGADDKLFEAKVAKDTKAKEVNITFKCVACGKKVGEFDVVTGKGIVKEVKSSASDIDVKQLHKEIALAADFIGPNTVVHWAIPSGQRKDAAKRFKRPGGRPMTNKGAGYNHLIQEH